MMEFFMKSAKDEDAKSKYIDTLMMVYDVRIENFGKEGFVLYEGR